MEILYDCPIEEDLSQFFAEKLSSRSLEDYPEGIVLPIDKPYRWTSADVVRKVKFQLQKHFNLKKMKVGHAGTLDPLATGLLIVCAGNATKQAEQFQAQDKIYTATFEFGATTPSFDLEQPVDSYFPFEHITEDSVREALAGFLGEQQQVPPMFSAKMVGGMRAYEYARTGQPVELSTSSIRIDEIELLEFHKAGEAPDGGNETAAGKDRPDLAAVRNVHNYHISGGTDGQRPWAVVRIRCSKGTYIRSIARDLGLALNSGAFLTALRRNGCACGSNGIGGVGSIGGGCSGSGGFLLLGQ